MRILRLGIAFAALLITVACTNKDQPWNWATYAPPDWHRFVPRSASRETPPTQDRADRADGHFTFGDLKHESDASLARRLLGAAGARIAYVDRHRSRWTYYGGDGESARSIDLYTHPEALGSQFGLCGVEKYSVEFDDGGKISTVRVSQRFGVEGPVFQKNNFDWDYYYYERLCSAASADHAPNYFPAHGSSQAQDVAILLGAVIDIAGKPVRLPFKLSCIADLRDKCTDRIRSYLASMRLDEINDVTLENCPLSGGPDKICFTVIVGEGRLGPFPKHITVQGSYYMNKLRLDAVRVSESFTMS